jgi:hypothetical protein
MKTLNKTAVWSSIMIALLAVLSGCTTVVSEGSIHNTITGGENNGGILHLSIFAGEEPVCKDDCSSQALSS